MNTMDINKEWQKFEQANFNQTVIKKEEIMKAIQLESTSTIAEIKKSLRQKINWAKCFVLMFAIIAALNYSNTGIISLMALAALVYVLGIVLMGGEYAKMNPDINASNSILEAMKDNLAAIKSALQKERIFGLIAVPIMMVVGLSYSKLKEGQTFTEILSSEYSMISMVLYVVLIIALGVGAEKMNKMAFGSQITKLERQIKELDKIN